MPKVKIKIAKGDVAKVHTAADLAGVRVLETVEVGKNAVLQIQYASIDSVLDMGSYMETIKDADIAAYAQKVKAARAKEAAKTVKK